MRKTYTSSAVKNRWNKKHYDQISVRVPIGSKVEIQKMLEERGDTMAGYIKRLIIEDAKTKGYNAVSEALGGGVHN